MREMLNRRLVIEAPIREEAGEDGAGGGTIVWTPLGMIWARIEAGTGRGAAGDAYPLGVVPLRITVRAAPVGATGRPEPGQRFREGTRRYPILSVTEKDACGRYLLCSAIEETPA